MLKFYMKKLCADELKDKGKNFYDVYKWEIALLYLFEDREFIICIIICLFGMIFDILQLMSLTLIFFAFSILALIKYIYHLVNSKKQEYANKHMNISRKLSNFIRKHFVTQKGNVLTKKDWKMIKKLHKSLYADLTSDKCNHCCYFYSREIALIIQDVNLIWCGVKDPFNKKIYAHAIIKKDGEVYDSNRRISYDFEKYKQLYDLKIYKEWSYLEYSQYNFRAREREEFRKWCRENNVVDYELF